jgi:hypothetical protein
VFSFRHLLRLIEVYLLTNGIKSFKSTLLLMIDDLRGNDPLDQSYLSHAGGKVVDTMLDWLKETRKWEALRNLQCSPDTRPCTWLSFHRSRINLQHSLYKCLQVISVTYIEQMSSLPTCALEQSITSMLLRSYDVLALLNSRYF